MTAINYMPSGVSAYATGRGRSRYAAFDDARRTGYRSALRREVRGRDRHTGLVSLDINRLESFARPQLQLLQQGLLEGALVVTGLPALEDTTGIYGAYRMMRRKYLDSEHAPVAALWRDPLTFTTHSGRNELCLPFQVQRFRDLLRAVSYTHLTLPTIRLV